MESSVNNGMCRCCASEGTFKDVKSAYHWMGEEEVYWNMLQECFDVALTTTDNGDDGGICEVCITQLRNASNFKKQVQHTEEQFKLRIQGKLFKSDIVKLEPAKDEESDNSDHLETEDFSGTEFEIPIKTETVEEPKPKKRAAAPKASTSRAKKAKANDGETSTKRAQQSANAKTDHVKEEETEEDSGSDPVWNIQLESENHGAQQSANAKTDHVKEEETEEGSGSVPVWNIQLESEKHGNSDELNRKLDIDRHISNLKEILLCSNATPLKAGGYLSYKCCFCPSNYPQPAELKRHTIEAHADTTKEKFALKNTLPVTSIKLDITSLKCKICDGDFDALEQFVQHLEHVHNKKVFTCGLKFILPFNFDTDEIRCCICTAVFNSFRQCILHMTTHYANYICDQCGAGFMFHNNLLSHVSTHNTSSDASFTCTYCPKTFPTIKKRTTHQYQHTRPLRFRCAYCTESFSGVGQRSKHLIEAHGLCHTLKCETCGNTFTNSYSLRQHIRKVHMSENLIPCPICDKAFVSPSNLKKHMTKHSDACAFSCTVCQKGFKWKHNLTMHMRLHLGQV